MNTIAFRCAAVAIALAGASIVSPASADPLGYAGPFGRQASVFDGVVKDQPVEETQEQPATELPANLRRQVVDYRTSEAPGTVIVDTPNTYLYYVLGGGPGNPLGARAMYIGGTVYRIHGTNAPDTIGKRVSSGCIRLTNEDVEDLYSRVTVGTKVVVMPTRGAPIALN